MKKLLPLLLLLLAFAACKQQTAQQRFTIKGETMGSYYSIIYIADKELVTQAETDSFLVVFNKSISTWDKTSLITSINKAGDKHVTDSFFRQLYRKSKEVHHLSNGVFDPTGSPLFEAWGFDFKNAENMDSAKVDSLLKYVGIDKTYLRGDTVYKMQKNIRFSFNAIAPGYAADLLAQMLQQKGIHNFLIDVSGEFVAHGHKEQDKQWQVGIEKPIENKEKQNEALAYITLEHNEALATSGNYRKFYYINGKRYSHTINPKNGYPVAHNLLSATIIAPDAATADAFATTCMVLGLEEAKKFVAKQKDIKAYFIYDEGGKLQEYVSDNLKQQLSK